MKLRSDTSIKTERLWLRQIDETDAESIVRLRSDDEVYKCFLNPVKITVDDHRQWYDEQYKNDENRIDWIAVDDETGDFIGVYGAKRVESDTVEISYITKPDKQGCGYAKEAVEAIILFCKKVWEARVAEVRVNINNIGSRCFADKLGFQKVSEDDTFIAMTKAINEI